MLSIIIKQFLKYKKLFIFVFISWIIFGWMVYQNRYRLLVLFYQISSRHPDYGKENPEKAYYDFVLPALNIWEENQIDLKKMSELCPKTLTYQILDNKEYEWHFLKKYQFFSLYNKEYISFPSTLYWKSKKNYVLESILYLKEALKYALEIPASITKEKKNILIPYLIQQSYNAICLPQEARSSWKMYIDYLETHSYLSLQNQKKRNHNQELNFPSEFDLELLEFLENNLKYMFAIYQYTGKMIPFQYLHRCPSDSFLCSSLEEINVYLNKLIFVSPENQWGNLFLFQARLYFIMGKKKNQPMYFQLSLDRYAGAKEFSRSRIDAYLESAYVFLYWNQPENAFRELKEFSKIRPSRFVQKKMYYELLYKTLTQLKHYKEAECFRDMTVELANCKQVRKEF